MDPTKRENKNLYISTNAVCTGNKTQIPVDQYYYQHYGDIYQVNLPDICTQQYERSGTNSKFTKYFMDFFMAAYVTDLQFVPPLNWWR